MCIRYDLDTGEALRWSKEVGAWIPETDYKEGLDTYPGYVAPAVKPFWGPGRPKRTLAKMRWGLQPSWASDPRWGAAKAYNARSETIFELRSFRDPIRQRRCVIPLQAFYEQAGGRWWRFRHPEGLMLAVAGIYEESNALADLPTFSMVTTVANALAESVGHDRSLVQLDVTGIEAWLSPSTALEDLRSLMIPPPEELLIVEDAGPTKRKVDPTPSLFDLE